MTLKAMWKYPERTPLRMNVSNIFVSREEEFKTEFTILTGK
jgi:hypothetical protein